jgi:hypothetical protein
MLLALPLVAPVWAAAAIVESVTHAGFGAGRLDNEMARQDLLAAVPTGVTQRTV